MATRARAKARGPVCCNVCGAAALYHTPRPGEEDDGRAWHYVTCSDPDCGKAAVWALSKSAAVAAWNRRAKRG